MSSLLLIIYALVAAIILIAAFITLGSMRSRAILARALHMSLFLITLPRDEVNPSGGQQRPDKELIAVMEQLYASLSNLHASGWNKFLYGEPYVALELGVHHIGEEIHFYAAVPRSYEQVFEKQVHGLYPNAQVEQVKDYNIFNPNGAIAGVYLKLSNHEVLPFRTYARLESDPLGEVLTALSKLEREGEGAAIQILIRPSHRNDIRLLAQKVARHMQTGQEFNRALSLARSSKPQPSKDGSNLSEPPRVATPFEEDVIKALQAKASRALFDTNMRIIVSAADEVRAQQMLSDVTASFAQFSSPDLNSFKNVGVKGRSLDDLIFHYSFRLFDESQTIHLSSEELASVYHFPLLTTQAPRIKYLKTRFAEPPSNLPLEGAAIGMSKYRGQEVPIYLAANDRRRHLYVVGQTGTGKSSLMKYMIGQDIAAGKGVCIIDPHGEFAEYVLSVVPRERADDVIYFNPGDIEQPMGLNMLEFDIKRPEQKTFIANELLMIVKSLYPDVPEAFGPMFEQYFKNSILLLLDAHESNTSSAMPTLAEIPRVLTDDAYRRAKLAQEPNPLVKNFWELEAQKAGGDAALANMAPYITSKLNAFLSNDYLRPIIAQPKSAFNFRQIMDEQKIFIANLSKGQIGDLNAYLVGMIIVGKLLMAALARIDTLEDQRKDFYLYMDEFQSVTTPSIATILSEARKYRLNLIMAHQFIKQLREEIRNAVFGNVGSMVAFRVGADDAEFLKSQFEPVFTAQDLMSVDNFNAHVRLLINNQTTRPFNIQTVREPEGNPRVADALKEVSRLRYGRPRDEVEREIKDSYKTSL